MEIRVKEKTLRSMFLQYMAIFCVNTIIICGISFGGLVALSEMAQILPANYTEQWINEHETAIRTLEDISDLEFPEDSRYGVYTKVGKWLYGTIAEEDRIKTWEGYEKQDMSAVSGFYRFFVRENGDVCIVKYYFRMRYAFPELNRLLPNPEMLLPLVIGVLFIIQAIVLAGRFSKNLKKRLEQLENVTQKISENDLEFSVGASDIKEINDVFYSLGQMKEALQISLKKQWDMETEQNRQMRALVHDIKTPLTIIRGNAELAAEDIEMMCKEMSASSGTEEETGHAGGTEIKSQPAEKMEDTKAIRSLNGIDNNQRQILEYVGEIEQYLDKMRLILQHQKTVDADKEIGISCTGFQKQLKMQAEQMASAKNIPLMIRCRGAKGAMQVNLEQLKRAWGNVLSNAIEYTDKEQGIDVHISEEEKNGNWYLCVQISDYGPGFSEEELRYATEEFYRGDESRHDRSHQGLGLSIAKRFVEAQGGFLRLRNSAKTGGGEVSLWMKIEKQ